MNENEVRALLFSATQDRPPGLDLMAAVPAMQARPAGRPIRALVPLAALGVAAAVVVSVILLALPVVQPSAQAEMVAAIDNTSQQSYRIHSTAGSRTFEGACDPVQHVAVLKGTGEDAETRFVGDLMYVWEPSKGKWTAYPRADLEFATAPVVIAVVKLAALDPQRALQRLRSATDVRAGGSASGPGWTGKRFTFSLVDTDDAKRPGVAALTITGVVDVDDQGRVRRLQLQFGDDGQRNVMEFGDFGTPVSVTAPPAGEVEQGTSGDQGGGKGSDDPTARPTKKVVPSPKVTGSAAGEPSETRVPKNS